MKITQKQFEEFKTECLKLLNDFHLNDWDVYFEFEKIDEQANCYVIPDGNITITLATEINFLNKNKNEYLKELAKHEIIHCLIGRFSSLARDRYINEKELDTEEEHLVRKLTKIIK